MPLVEQQINDENGLQVTRKACADQDDMQFKIHHLYSSLTVAELRDLMAIRRATLKKGYIKKAELEKLACQTHPAELDALVVFQNTLMQFGVEVKWRSRTLATAEDARKMAQSLAEQVDLLRRSLAWPAGDIAVDEENNGNVNGNGCTSMFFGSRAPPRRGAKI